MESNSLGNYGYDHLSNYSPPKAKSEKVKDHSSLSEAENAGSGEELEYDTNEEKTERIKSKTLTSSEITESGKPIKATEKSRNRTNDEAIRESFEKSHSKSEKKESTSSHHTISREKELVKSEKKESTSSHHTISREKELVKPEKKESTSSHHTISREKELVKSEKKESTSSHHTISREKELVKPEKKEPIPSHHTTSLEKELISNEEVDFKENSIRRGDFNENSKAKLEKPKEQGIFGKKFLAKLQEGFNAGSKDEVQEAKLNNYGLELGAFIEEQKKQQENALVNKPRNRRRGGSEENATAQLKPTENQSNLKDIKADSKDELQEVQKGNIADDIKAFREGQIEKQKNAVINEPKNRRRGGSEGNATAQLKPAENKSNLKDIKEKRESSSNG